MSIPEMHESSLRHLLDRLSDIFQQRVDLIIPIKGRTRISHANRVRKGSTFRSFEKGLAGGGW